MDSQTGDSKKLSILGLEKQAVGVGERTGQQWVLRGTARRGECAHMTEGRAFWWWILSNTGQAAIHSGVPL